MPRTRSLKWSELKIGVMAIVALVIAAALILALGGEGGFFWQRYNLKVKFSNAAGVQKRLAGAGGGRHGWRRDEHAVYRLGGGDGCSSCTRTCRTRSARPRARPSGRCRCSAKAPLTSAHRRPGSRSRNGATSRRTRPPPRWRTSRLRRARASPQLTSLIEDIRAGKGTVGKLMTDEQLYAELRQPDGGRAQCDRGPCPGQRHARSAA